MPRPRLLAALLAALLLPPAAASAQEAGGLPFAPPFAGPPVNRQPVPLSAVNPARARKGVHLERIARLRGDPGYLAGFIQGQPLAPSRQPPPPPLPPFVTIVQAPFIFNTIQSVMNVDLGDGTVETPDGAAEAPAPPATVDVDVLDGSVNIGGTVNQAIGSGNVAVQRVTGAP